MAQLVTEMLGCRDDHAAQLDERDPTDVDGAASREQEHPQRLLPLPRARERHRVGGEPCACGSDRVQWVVLAAQSTLAPGLAADLEHRLAALGEVTSQPSAVMASALDRPGTNARSVLVGNRSAAE